MKTNNIFLDDELLEFCKNVKVDTLENLQQLNADICLKCEKYYKNKITLFSTNNEVKAILDRTFNLFDSFVKMALKNDNKQLQIIGLLFKDHTFKKQLLSNERINKIYNKL